MSFSSDYKSPSQRIRRTREFIAEKFSEINRSIDHFEREEAAGRLVLLSDSPRKNKNKRQHSLDA